MTGRVATLAILFGATPFSTLLNMGYSAWSLELVAVTCGFVIAGALAGLLARKAVAYAALFCLGLYAFADANIVGDSRLEMVAMAILCVAALVGFNKIQSWAPAVASTFALMFSLTSVLSTLSVQAPAWAVPAQPAQALPRNNKPSVLHIVLDEMATPVVSSGAPAPGHPASTLLDDLASRGFKVYDKADSSTFNTYRSVSAVLGLTTSTENFHKLRDGGFTFEVLRPELFTSFKQAGFDVHAVQYGFLKLCPEGEPFACDSYTRGFEMNVFAHMGLDAPERLKLAMLALHKTWIERRSRNTIALYKAGAKSFGRLQNYHFFSTPAVVLKLMDRIPEQVAARSGALSFYHLLLPHYPFILSADCKLKRISDWTYPAKIDRRHEAEAIYAGYWEQVACARNRLLAIIDAAANRADLTIIVHGDHGSRISRKTKHETAEDLHRTFLAIRGPGIVAGRNAEPVHLQQNLLEFYTGFLSSQR